MPHNLRRRRLILWSRRYLLRDTFADADATPLAAKPLQAGGTWATGAAGNAGTWATQAGRLLLTKPGSGPGRDYAWADARAADCVAQAAVRTGSGVNTPGLYLRATDASNGWLLRYYVTGNTLDLLQLQAGSFTLRGSASVALALNTDYALRAACCGSRITCSLNGVPLIDYHGATFNQSATLFGVHSANDDGAGSVAAFDDFEVTAT